jgi:hypothetical protein
VAVGAPLLAEHITPITAGSDFEGAEEALVKPVFASILHLANAGEAAVSVSNTNSMRLHARFDGALLQEGCLALRHQIVHWLTAAQLHCTNQLRMYLHAHVTAAQT